MIQVVMSPDGISDYLVQAPLSGVSGQRKKSEIKANDPSELYKLVLFHALQNIIFPHAPVLRSQTKDR